MVHYVRLEGGVPQEAAYEKPDVKPPSEWPTQGAVEFKDVRMCYRPGLPEVLKGINLNVKGGEKIGVVGRYAISLFLLKGVVGLLDDAMQNWSWEVDVDVGLVSVFEASVRTADRKLTV